MVWEADDVVYHLHDPAQVSSLGLGEAQAIYNDMAGCDWKVYMISSCKHP